MDFELNQRQRELQERAREAVSRVVVPVVERIPPGERIGAESLREIYRGLAPLGYLGSVLPKEAGGAGLSYVDYGLLIEALADAPIVLSEVVVPQTVFFLGDAEQQARWLPGLLSGESIATAAITEPQAGSDVRGILTRAVPRGDAFVLSGRKKWILLGGVSDLVTVLAVTDPDARPGTGTSRLLVDRSESPWTSTDIECVGMRNLSLAELHFDDVEVPRRNLLGSAGAGVEAFYRAVEASRALLALEAAGMAQAALERAGAYVRERAAFGRTLARMQAIQGALADAAANVDAARLLALRALGRLDAGQRCPREASMAKVYATEAAVCACSTAMDCMGAHGLSAEAGVERLWRDARMLTVMDGTAGIQRLIVGREMLGTAAFA